MKARIKKTGEIVNLASYATITLDVCDSWGNPIEMKPEEIELIQDKTDDFDWQSFRAEAAKDILSNSLITYALKEFSEESINIDYWTDRAIEWTDVLVKQLREKEEK